MQPAVPRISLVIACRNEHGRIEACLESALSQIAPEGGFEVIVADGMSDDGTRRIVQGIADKANRNHADAAGPIIRVVENPRRIVSNGLNAAIRAAHGEVIIRMDAHTDYASDYVVRCDEILRQTGADNVGGPARTKAAGYLQQAVAAAYHSSFSVGGARFHNPEYEGWVDTVTYGCWRKQVFERFGYFDEELVRNQDDEHNLRIIRGGGQIWQSPRIKSWYRPRASLGALFNQYKQYGYWKVRVIHKHKLPASWRHLVPGAFVLTLLMLALASVFSAMLALIRQDASRPVLQLPLITLLLVAGIYLVTVLCASVHTSARSQWKLLPTLPIVFVCYHFGYGCGFLRGVWDFLLCRKKGGAKSFEVLTR